jgi:rfaE bifunctional protein kinase chain/domain
MAGMTPERADELIAAMKGVHVLIVGDFMIDRYVSGVVDRISPEAPVPVVRVDEERSAIGGAGNVAANVTALGASCSVVGCVGTDAPGKTLRAALEAIGVRPEGLVEVEDRPTTVKTRVMARQQQIVRFDHEVETDVSEGVAARITLALEELARSSDVVVVSDYNKGVLVPPVIASALGAAEAKSVPSVVDPKRRGFFAYQGATVFKPNAKELEDAVGDHIHPDDPAWMEAIRQRLDCDHLLLTLGARGIALQSTGEGLERVPTVARSVYDVSGAGDTVTACVAATLAAGGTVLEAAILANHAAAVEVGKAGVATVSSAEMREHLGTSGV